MHNSESILGNETHKCHWDSLISSRWPVIIIINNKKKRTCRIVDIAVLVDHRVKLKENEKKFKHLDLARELEKKLWNMKVKVILVVIGALGTVIKGLVQGLEELGIRGRVKTIQATALLRSARLLRRVPETWFVFAFFFCLFLFVFCCFFGFFFFGFFCLMAHRPTWFI